MKALLLAALLSSDVATTEPCRMPVTLSFRDAPLTQLVQVLEGMCRRRIIVKPALGGSERVTIEVKDEPFDTVLSRLLEPRGYAWVYGDGTFGLSQPPHAARLPGGQDAVVEFGWTRAPEAAAYRFLLAAGRDFGRPLVERRLQATTERVKGLKDGTYYWRVDALDAAGNILYLSEQRRFEVRSSAAGSGGPPSR